MELVNGQIYKRNFQCFALLFVTSKNSKAYYSMLHISGHRDPKLTCPLIQHSGKGKYVFTEEELRKTFDADNWEPVEGKLIIDLQIDHIGGEDERNIRDLLCIIHRDGGHYISKHGIQKAFDDALKIHYRQRDAEEHLSTIAQQSLSGSKQSSSPKLPSVGDIMKFNPSLNYDDVHETLHAVYRLGNFA